MRRLAAVVQLELDRMGCHANFVDFVHLQFEVGIDPLLRKNTATGQELVIRGKRGKGRYSSVSEYVRELIRADERRKAEEQLEAKLLEGLSGAESELTPADWSAIRREALAKVEARKQPR